jgi:hypothetical protein
MLNVRISSVTETKKYTNVCSENRKKQLELRKGLCMELFLGTPEYVEERF